MLTCMSETAPVVEGMFDDDGLIGGACEACGRRHFPLAGTCPWCGTAGPTRARLSAAGQVWAGTTVHTAPPGYDGPVPFGFGVVELADDGLQVVTLLTGDPAVGDAVRFTTTLVGNGILAWAFAPQSETDDRAEDPAR